MQSKAQNKEKIMEKTVSATIEGISPLLMHRFPLEEGGTTPKGFDKWPADKQAEFAAYRDPDTQELRFASEAIRQAMIAAAKWSKGKGRASLKTEVAASVLLEPLWCGLGVEDFVIDTRSIVNQNTKGRILCHRPRLNQWTLSFTIHYDPILLTPAQLRTVLEDAGQRVGIGPFRPACEGYFGRFLVKTWHAAE